MKRNASLNEKDKEDSVDHQQVFWKHKKLLQNFEAS